MGPRGDMVNERTNIMPGGYLAEDPITIHPDVLDEHCVDVMNRLHRTCEEAGATLLVTYPPIARPAVVSSEEDKLAFSLALQQRLEAPVIGQLSDSVLDPSLFYDTNYHLNTVGSQQRTYLLFDLLSPYCSDPQ